MESACWLARGTRFVVLASFRHFYAAGNFKIATPGLIREALQAESVICAAGFWGSAEHVGLAHKVVQALDTTAVASS